MSRPRPGVGEGVEPCNAGRCFVADESCSDVEVLPFWLAIGATMGCDESGKSVDTAVVTTSSVMI